MKKITEGKICVTITKYLQNKQNLFIIYPYGNRGKLVERIIKEDFPNVSYVVADNYISEGDILTLNQLHDLEKTHVLLLCSDNPDIYGDIRKNLKEEFKGTICDLAEIDVPEKNVYGLRRHKMLIDDINEEQMINVFEKTKRAWKKLGEEEPYFSVVTHDDLRTENITEETIVKFYENGQAKTQEILNYLWRHGAGDPLKLSVLELGCGCGRVTKSLVENFAHVVAIDISEANLNIAKEHVVSDKVDFGLITKVEDYQKLPEVNVIYSYIVLQHNCPPVIEYILKAMMNKLKKNGIFLFQIPTYRRGYSFVYEDYMKQPEGMEMHCFPQEKIFELAYANQCIPLEVHPCKCTAQDDDSMMFILKKLV